MDILDSYINTYRDECADNVVDSAVNYIHNAVSFTKTTTKIFNRGDSTDIDDYINTDMLTAYMTGVRYAVENNIDDIKTKNKEKQYHSYRKNKDFCVAFYFGDNDFGYAVREAAEMYAKHYNYILNCINNYTDEEFSTIEHKSSYVADLTILETLKYIRHILKTGYVSSHMKSVAENCGCYISESYPDDIYNDAKSDIEYLGFDDDKKWFIGTLDSVQDQILDRFKSCVVNPETTDISNIWINGECLFIAVIDGDMKVWLR